MRQLYPRQFALTTRKPPFFIVGRISTRRMHGELDDRKSQIYRHLVAMLLVSSSLSLSRTPFHPSAIPSLIPYIHTYLPPPLYHHHQPPPYPASPNFPYLVLTSTLQFLHPIYLSVRPLPHLPFHRRRTFHVAVQNHPKRYTWVTQGDVRVPVSLLTFHIGGLL